MNTPETVDFRLTNLHARLTALDVKAPADKDEMMRLNHDLQADCTDCEQIIADVLRDWVEVLTASDKQALLSGGGAVTNMRGLLMISGGSGWDFQRPRLGTQMMNGQATTDDVVRRWDELLASISRGATSAHAMWHRMQSPDQVDAGPAGAGLVTQVRDDPTLSERQQNILQAGKPVQENSRGRTWRRSGDARKKKRNRDRDWGDTDLAAMAWVVVQGNEGRTPTIAGVAKQFRVSVSALSGKRCKMPKTAQKIKELRDRDSASKRDVIALTDNLEDVIDPAEHGERSKVCVRGVRSLNRECD